MRWFLLALTVTLRINDILANNEKKSVSIKIPSPRLEIQSKPILDDVQLYEIPGYNGLLRVSPKKIANEVERPISEIRILNNQHRVFALPQQRECDDKTNKLKTFMSFLKKGIYHKKQLLRKLFAPEPNPIIIIKEQVKYPVEKEIEKPQPALGIKYTKTTEVESASQPVAIPIPAVAARKEVKVSEVVQPKYSYKQASKDGTVMSYEFEDNPNIIVTKTEAMPALPTYIKSRFEKVVSAVNEPVFVAPGMVPNPAAIIAENIGYGLPIIPGDIASVITPLPPFTPPIIPPAYVRLQNMGYLNGGSFYGPPILVEEDIPVLLRTQTNIFKTSGPKGDVNVKITKNKPSNVFNSKTNYGAMSISNTSTNGIPPPPTLSNINTNSNNIKISHLRDSTLSQSPVSSVNNDMSSVKEQGSFVYRQVNNNNLQPLDISQASYNHDTKTGPKNGRIDDISDRLSNSYYFVPPVNGNIEPSPVNSQATSFSTRVTTKLARNDAIQPCVGSIKVTKLSTCETYYGNYGSTETSPIVVPDSAAFVYKQINADGSSISTIGTQNNVVDVKASSSQANRGDIPESRAYK